MDQTPAPTTPQPPTPEQTPPPPQVPTPPPVPAPMGGPAPHGEPVPTGEWPGAFKIYSHSKQAVLYNIGTVLGLIGLSIILSIASSMVRPSSSYSGGDSSIHYSTAGGFIYLLCQLASLLIGIASLYTLFAGVKRQKISVSEALSFSWKKFFPYLGLIILLGLITVASVLLFIIPAFFIVPRIILAPYYLLEGNVGVMEAISVSWEASKGNVDKIWGIIGVNLLIVLLAFTIIGIPFAIYFGIMYEAAYVILYFWLKNHQYAQAQSPAGPVIEQR